MQIADDQSPNNKVGCIIGLNDHHPAGNLSSALLNNTMQQERISIFTKSLLLGTAEATSATQTKSTDAGSAGSGISSYLTPIKEGMVSACTRMMMIPGIMTPKKLFAESVEKQQDTNKKKEEQELEDMQLTDSLSSKATRRYFKERFRRENGELKFYCSKKWRLNVDSLRVEDPVFLDPAKLDGPVSIKSNVGKKETLAIVMPLETSNKSMEEVDLTGFVSSLMEYSKPTKKPSKKRKHDNHMGADAISTSKKKKTTHLSMTPLGASTTGLHGYGHVLHVPSSKHDDAAGLEAKSVQLPRPSNSYSRTKTEAIKGRMISEDRFDSVVSSIGEGLESCLQGVSHLIHDFDIRETVSSTWRQMGLKLMARVKDKEFTRQTDLGQDKHMTGAVLASTEKVVGFHADTDNASYGNGGLPDYHTCLSSSQDIAFCLMMRTSECTVQPVLIPQRLFSAVYFYARNFPHATVNVREFLRLLGQTSLEDHGQSKEKADDVRCFVTFYTRCELSELQLATWAMRRAGMDIDKHLQPVRGGKDSVEVGRRKKDKKRSRKWQGGSKVLSTMRELQDKAAYPIASIIYN